MKFFFFTLLSFFLMTAVSAQDNKPAYRFFDKEGKPVSYSKVLKRLGKADVVFFGELHNNPICHWLQYEMTVDLHKEHGAALKLGAEMFEADNQLIMDEYLSGKIKERHFEAEARLWNNYETDYKPLVNFAKEKNLHFVATNIPRRYAAMVSSGGLDALEGLQKPAKAFIAPLPIALDLSLPGYKNMLDMFGGNSNPHMNPEFFAAAQAIKDATMAHFIVKALDKKEKMLHYNGAYHSDNFEGIVWYLKKYNKKLDASTITSVEQDDLSSLADEHKGKADFILVIPKRMTKTY